ncbi:16S rRNA (cytosine(1402)-N(4))-methyltransferase RsmH [Sphingomonas changnyeongensis]|uniref:Ribosomal RNA small subunit methyltransferase H n=1 Tax=Sphingomonas changnyeongensis TaxID=2698679 RepID=A0A7Z2NU25_9SPHN|nr:16S rRNA (cytosine(1402)-N(4))-methyltransferase RsmH [Sphingomonas changnyeongensis]QHL89597.1 16S rRNA (cytosine(1402)-N(4))-methyltransferase RsmH [Sphingomonas changnyeongensis]
MSGVPTAADRAPHVPVLLDEVLAGLAIAPGECHVDGTFGAGGYSRAMIDAGARVIAFDRDPDAIAAGRAVEAASGGRLVLVPRRFSEMAAALAELGQGPVDGLTLDIGVSSMQLDRPERGFSVQADGPLDMRMEQDGPSAADWLNAADEAEIADIIYRYGEDRRSRRIARAIVQARPLARTAELAAAVRRAVGYVAGRDKDPAVQVFQAIRIHLNRELDELEDGLRAAEQVLAPGGRLAVVTFHSLEDRIVKAFLRDRSGAAPGGSRHLPAAAAARAPSFEAVARPVRPGGAELAVNPRARSATLRVARRTAAAPWGASSAPTKEARA